MDGLQSDKVNINVGGGDGGGGGAGLAALIAAMNSGGGDNNIPALIAAMGNRPSDGGGMAALAPLLAAQGNNGMNNLWPIILLALLGGRGRGGLFGGGDAGDCAVAGGIGPGQAAILQTLLEGQSSLRAEVPTTSLQTQNAIQAAISALGLGTQQGFSNIKDSVQTSSAFLDRDLQMVNQNVSAQGCQTREAVAASTQAILSRIDRSEIDELRDARNRFERQVEVNALRSQVEVNQTVNTTTNQAQAQAQSQLQFQDIANRIGRLCDRVDVVHQEQRSTNANIIAGNTGAVTTGAQSSTPTNVNAH